MQDLKASAGNRLTADDPTVLGLINDALTKAAVVNPFNANDVSVKKTSDTKKPSTMGGPEWALLKAQLDRAVTMRCDNWPWDKSKAVVLDSRAYHQSYNWEWVSYDLGARTGTEVRDYQFRSPAEWFAELYAYTWFNKKKAPGGVDKTVSKYMFSAKA